MALAARDLGTLAFSMSPKPLIRKTNENGIGEPGWI
jgi:hypothetical protein